MIVYISVFFAVSSAFSAKIFQNRGTQHSTGTVSNEATSDMGYGIWSIQRTCSSRIVETVDQAVRLRCSLNSASNIHLHFLSCLVGTKMVDSTHDNRNHAIKGSKALSYAFIVLSTSKCVSCGVCPTGYHRAGTSILSNCLSKQHLDSMTRRLK